jgi:hypothetical protein
MSAKLLFGAALGCAMLVTPAFAQTTEPTSWRRPLPPKRQVNGAPPGLFFPIERTPPSKPHHRQGGNLKPRDRLGLQISSACDRRQADSIPDNFSSLTVFMHELRRIRTNNEIELINEVEPAVFEISCLFKNSSRTILRMDACALQAAPRRDAREAAGGVSHNWQARLDYECCCSPLQSWLEAIQGKLTPRGSSRAGKSLPPTVT